MDHVEPELTARLEAERATTLERLANLRGDFRSIVDASAQSNADDEHDPEGSTIAFERSQVDALIRQAERHLAELDEAERRVQAGSFGICEVCGQPIPRARVMARLTARTCVGCA